MSTHYRWIEGKATECWRLHGTLLRKKENNFWSTMSEAEIANSTPCTYDVPDAWDRGYPIGWNKPVEPAPKEPTEPSEFAIVEGKVIS
jgi:hypothetical protein